MNGKYLLPAGKYFIGDPCYVIETEKWMDFLTEMWYQEKLQSPMFWFEGELVFVSSTMYGDGVYTDGYDDYPVDAGLIGVVPYTLCKRESMTGHYKWKELGALLDFERPFYCEVDDQCTITINVDRVIVTDGSDQDDYDYDWEEGDYG